MMASQQDIVSANTEFALDLFRCLPRGENVFFSPLGVSAALALTLVGARGDTQSAMKASMKLKKGVDVRSAFGDVIDALNRSTDGYMTRMVKRLFGVGGYTTRMANCLFGADGYGFLADFLSACKKFGAELQTLDFKNERASRKAINDWVEDQTNGKIKDLIKAGALTDETKMVLVNAIYFKGDWKKAFKKKATWTSKFHVTAKETMDVQMMCQLGKFQFGTDEELKCQVLELPYGQKDEMSMFILLPFQVDGLAALESTLTKDALFALPSKLHKMKVDVSIPTLKFELEFDLNSILADLGMGVIFERGKADFSGMDGTRELFVSKAVHKAFIDVNEKGTEAAAATETMMEELCDGPLPPPSFEANRPFLFFIQDKRTRSVTFMGRVVRPVVED